MGSVTRWELAWELCQAGMDPGKIGERVSRDRATVYRWLQGIRWYGIRQFVRRKREAYARRQPRKVVGEVARLTKQIRREYDWCGQKIRKELKEVHGIRISVPTVYRILHPEFEIGSAWRKYRKRGTPPKATKPREIVQHDTVDFGEVFAHTSLDVFTKEPSVVMVADLTSATGVAAFEEQATVFGAVDLHQTDEGPEFKGDYVATVETFGSSHRYARPYKKNDQSFIENFNRSLRNECLGWGKYRSEDLEELQARVDAYLHHFVHERWHMGLPDMMTPAQFRVWYAEHEQRAEPSVAFAP